MSTLAMHVNNASLFARGAPPVGNAGQKVGSQVAQALKVMKGGTRGSAVFHDLHNLAAENGTSVASNPLFSLALRFLTSFPVTVSPELALDNEGDIVFDWQGSHGEMLTIALRQDGRMAYACRLSAFDKEHGTKFFSTAVPKSILACVDRFVAKAA